MTPPAFPFPIFTLSNSRERHSPLPKREAPKPERLGPHRVGELRPPQRGLPYRPGSLAPQPLSSPKLRESSRGVLAPKEAAQQRLPKRKPMQTAARNRTTDRRCRKEALRQRSDTGSSRRFRAPDVSCSRSRRDFNPKPKTPDTPSFANPAKPRSRSTRGRLEISLSGASANSQQTQRKAVAGLGTPSR